MTDQNSTELPLETTVGAAGSHATEAFALLADETRLAILLALWEEYDPHATDNIVSFSEIFDRVDYEDPGSFSYHLQQLSGQFICQYADREGYELRVPALRFIHAVIAGAGMEDETLEPTEITQPCPFCDAPTAISYEEGLVVHVCTECEGVTTGEDIRGYLSAVPFDPAGLPDRSPEEIRAASRAAAWRQTQLMFEGLCPACSGSVESWLETEVPPEQTVQFTDLPAVDRETFAENDLADGDVVGIGTTFVYTDEEVSRSALVPESQYDAIVWANGNRAEWVVDDSFDTPIHSYEYTAEVVESTAEYGRQVREEVAFPLEGVTDAQRDIIQTAREDRKDSFDGYIVGPDEQTPPAFVTLAKQFLTQSQIHQFGQDPPDDLNGRYLVQYDGDTLLTALDVQEEVRTATEPTTA